MAEVAVFSFSGEWWDSRSTFKFCLSSEKKCECSCILQWLHEVHHSFTTLLWLYYQTIITCFLTGRELIPFTCLCANHETNMLIREQWGARWILWASDTFCLTISLFLGFVQIFYKLMVAINLLIVSVTHNILWKGITTLYAGNAVAQRPTSTIPFLPVQFISTLLY